MSSNRYWLAAFATTLAGSARAWGPYPRKELPVYGPNGDILSVNRSISVSYLRSILYYDEPSANTGASVPTDYLDYEQGWMNGAKIAASWMTSDQWYFDGEWVGAEGQIAYTGYACMTTAPFTCTPANLTSRTTTQDYSVKVGHGINTAERWMLTPYLSLGGRNWTRVIGLGTTNGATETYNHQYFSFGGRVQYNPWDRLVGTIDFAVGSTFNATINDPADGFNHSGLGSSAIFKAGAEVDERVSEHVHLFTSFDYMSFNYGRSSVVFSQSIGQNVFEPDSNTQVYNFNFGARYSFGGRS